MPSSGVEIADQVAEAFDQLKNPPKNLHWVKFCLNEPMTRIELKEKCEKTREFDVTKFDELFTGTECFYLVAEFKLPRDKDGREQEKLVFVSWVPEDAKIKKKMMYASSAESLKLKLDGVGTKIEAHDSDDVTYEAVKAAILATK